MGVNTQKYIRKPLYVEAVRVTPDNFDELAKWCQGEVETKNNSSRKNKRYIKVRVHHPKNPRQTQAFVGDWILYTDRGYKVYTNDAFNLAFDLVEDVEKTQPPEYPYEEGDITVLGPEIFVGKNDTGADVISWKGENYVTQAVPFPDVKPGADLGSTPQGEKIEVVEATPEAIADVVNEQQPPQRTEHLKDEMRPLLEEEKHVPVEPEHLEDAPSSSTVFDPPKPGEDRNHWEDTPIAPPPTPAIVPPEPEEPRLQTETGPDHKLKHEPVSQQPPENAAEGKYVLSEKEQADLGPEGVREMLASGEAILAQDLAETA